MSIDTQDGGLSLFTVLQEVMVADLNEMATVLVKLFLGCDQVISFLDIICQQEVDGCGEHAT